MQQESSRNAVVWRVVHWYSEAVRAFQLLPKPHDAEVTQANIIETQNLNCISVSNTFVGN